MSFQFHGRQFTCTQPDGAKFPVRGWGDQRYATFETLDGHGRRGGGQSGRKRKRVSSAFIRR